MIIKVLKEVRVLVGKVHKVYRDPVLKVDKERRVP
jgi:hypothetical protein